MREIKFRSFNKATGKMLDLYKVTPLALDANLNCDGLFLPFKEEYVLMQFTGLLDKNGKEIYEGDIVKFAFDWDYLDKECIIREFKKGKKVHNYIGQIDWEGEEFAHFVINPKRMNLMTDSFLIEVIGNIYENPELFKT